MKAFRKDFFREILKNKGRFLSVFFISLLGAAFFSGIRSAEGDMKTSADAYYDQTNYMDLRVLGTLGLTDADVEDIEKVKGVAQVTGGHTLEVLHKEGEKEQTVKLIALEDGVNEHGLAVGLTSVYPNQCKPGFNAGMIVRYLLEKCRNVSEAVSCLYQLPIASAQTLTLADTMGAIAVIECNAEQIKIEKTLNSNLAFVCATNTFHLPGMVGYNNDKIDNWFAEERYQTLYSAFSEKNGGFNFPFAEKLLSGDYGFLCQYDRSTGKDTVWSVIYDMKRHKIYRSEGNPGRHKFKEDTRFQF